MSADHARSAVAFLPVEGQGFTLPYMALTLHALTPAAEGSPAHIYCQVDESDAAPAGANGGAGAEGTNGDNGEVDGIYEPEEFTAMREIRIFVVEDKCA
jgi:nucleotide-sensitive chloride channel 1A